MSGEADLIQRREEIKHQLIAGECKTLMDIVLDGIGRFIQKFTRNSALPPFWYSALILVLAIWLISLLLSILFGEFHSARREFIQNEIMIGVLLLVIWIGLKIYIDSFFAKLHDYFLDRIESEADLADLQRWLVAFGNLKRPLVIGLIYGVLQGLNRTIFHTVRLDDFIGIGPMIFLILIHCFSVGIPVYYFFLFLALPVRLGRYHFKLYTVDPSSSETIDQLSDVLSNFVYLLSVITALGSVLSFLYAQWYVIGELAVVWVPLIVLFILNQYNLTKIITREKWKTLNEIQTEVESLQTSKNFQDKEMMETINRLIDYHDRIKATRSTALDFRAGLRLLNSLLLPVIGLLLTRIQDITRVLAELGS